MSPRSFPMKSKRFNTCLLALDTWLAVALLGCATRSDTPATESATPSSAEESQAAVAEAAAEESHAEVAEAAAEESHAESAESAEVPEVPVVKEVAAVAEVPVAPEAALEDPAEVPPAPEAPAVEAPEVPDTEAVQAPEVPAVATPAEAGSVPEAPASEMPAPVEVTPAPEVPAEPAPVEAVPAPEVPAEAVPAPEATPEAGFAPEAPASEIPAPVEAIPAPEAGSVPEASASGMPAPVEAMPAPEVPAEAVPALEVPAAPEVPAETAPASEASSVPEAPASEMPASAEPTTPAEPTTAESATSSFVLPPSSLAEATEAASAIPIPWRTPTYSLVARSMDLRQTLETFGTAQGIATILSPGVVGNLSGTFIDIPCDEFLDRLASLHNLSWYWDGAALFIYGPGETQTMLLDLRYMKAGEVRNMLAELGVEDPRFPLKTASNDELIMVSGPPRYVLLVAEMISKADTLREKRTFNEIETRIFPLQNTWADDVSFGAGSPESGGSIKGVATMLQQIVGKIATPDARDAGSTNAPAAFKPLITAENRLNAVIVTDVATRMPLYERLIGELDVPQQLLEIVVTVIEMSRKDALDWQLSIAANGTRGERVSGAAGQNPANLFEADSLEGRGLAGALTYLGSKATVAASLTALRDKGKARNISRTSLLTVNNLAAELSDTQSYHARVVGTEVAELATVSAGTTLQVKPRIMSPATPDSPSRIWLTLALGDGGFESVSVDSMPMSRSTSLDTQTSVYEGETIVLAGYLRDIEESAGWGIPLLRDIPIIGWLFGGHSSKTETVQRLFLISPHIVDAKVADLPRLQATRLRDTTDVEILQDDAEEDAKERKIRDIDRLDRRERREDELDEQLQRRKQALRRAREERERNRAERKEEWKKMERRWFELP